MRLVKKRERISSHQIISKNTNSRMLLMNLSNKKKLNSHMSLNLKKESYTLRESMVKFLMTIH